MPPVFKFIPESHPQSNSIFSFNRDAAFVSRVLVAEISTEAMHDNGGCPEHFTIG